MEREKDSPWAALSQPLPEGSSTPLNLAALQRKFTSRKRARTGDSSGSSNISEEASTLNRAPTSPKHSKRLPKKACHQAAGRGQNADSDLDLVGSMSRVQLTGMRDIKTCYDPKKQKGLRKNANRATVWAWTAEARRNASKAHQPSTYEEFRLKVCHYICDYVILTILFLVGDAVITRKT